MLYSLLIQMYKTNIENFYINFNVFLRTNGEDAAGQEGRKGRLLKATAGNIFTFKLITLTGPDKKSVSTTIWTIVRRSK